VTSKITKGQAGYIAVEGTNFSCQDCCFLKDLGGGAWGCAYFGPGDPISRESGSCNRWAFGHRGTELPWLNNFTKLELGYAENPTGFGCVRCEYFGMAKRDCKKVDKDSPGDTAGEISTYSCCDFQESDSWRGKLDRRELSELIQLTDKGAGRMTADEYRRFKEMGG
jgi:hypothetical protein